MAPVVIALRSQPRIESIVCVTAQHREMLDQVLQIFDVKPDYDLDLMRPDQTLAGLSALSLERIDRLIDKVQPDRIIVQGDTTTSMISALAAFYRKIPVGHVEAGLRTWNIHSPWPEELNRQVTGRIADLHFAPTERARENLVNEGVSPESVVVTGNTVIDALQLTVEKIRSESPLAESLRREFDFIDPKLPLVLVTGHRRENFGSGFENICKALRDLAKGGYCQVVYPVHLNPNVRDPVQRVLGSLENVHLIEPLPYISFVYLMQGARIVLTDSGGIQEEAPGLGKPVLVMRDTTERPEAVDAGTARLVGTDRKQIVDGALELLQDPGVYEKMSHAHNPFGDGKASHRIVEHIHEAHRI